MVTLCAATLALFSVEARFTTVARDILPNLAFANGFDHWRRSAHGVRIAREGGPAVVLDAGADGPWPALARPLPEPQRFAYVRVAADVKAVGIRPGPGAWQRGAIVVRSFDRAGRVLDYWPSEVVALAGTTDWRHRTAVFPVGPEIAAMQLAAYVGAGTGTLMVRRLAVDAVAEAPWFGHAQAALIAAWLAAAVWVVAPVQARRPLALGRLVSVLAGSVLVIGVLAPKPHLAHAVRTLDAGVSRMIAPASAPASDDGAAQRTVTPLRSTGAPPAAAAPATVRVEEWTIPGLGSQDTAHMLGHALFALIVLAAYRRDAPRHWLFVYLLVAALASEALQSFTLTRTAQAHDAVMNVAGLALAFALYELGSALLRRSAVAR